MNEKTQKKIAAILEVFGIYVVGQLVGFILAKVLGMPLRNPLTDLTLQTTSPEMRQITIQLLGVLFMQYTGWFILIFPVGWWYRRRKPKQYGLTLASKPLKFYLFAGVVLFAFSELPTQILTLLNSTYSLGEQIAWREAIYQISWNNLEFWLLMAVGSFGLIPVLEELFYRGYVQTRLEEDLGAPTAILAATALFAFSHSQYYFLNAYNMGTLATIIFSSLAYGYLFYRTRSLLVTIIPHILINIPVKGDFQWVLPAVMLFICILAWKDIYKYLSDFMQFIRDTPHKWNTVAVVVIVAMFAIAFTLLGDVVLLLGIVFFVVALVLEWLDKRRIKTNSVSIMPDAV